jgi:hypothetical protein
MLAVRPCPVVGNGDDVEGQSTAVHDVSGGGPMAWCRCVPCCWPTSAEQLAAEGSSEDPRHCRVLPPPPPAAAQVAETSGGPCHLPPPHLHHLHPPRPQYRYRQVPVNEAKIRPYTIHHTPYTINPKPSTLNPKPCLLGGAYPVSQRGGAYPVSRRGGAYHGWGGERAGVGRIECRGGAAKAPGWRGESAGVIRRGRRVKRHTYRVSGKGEARKRKRSGEQRSNPACISSYRRLLRIRGR